MNLAEFSFFFFLLIKNSSTEVNLVYDMLYILK